MQKMDFRPFAAICAYLILLLLTTQGVILGAQRGEGLWAFQKPVPYKPPAVDNALWVRNPIDAFILRQLEENALPPAPPASRVTLARRLYLDLIGMPPSREEIRTFLEDPSPRAYSQLVNRLLDDPRYGERWGRYWLDLVRYAESNGLEGDPDLGNVWRYRDWVIEAFSSDMPYNRFLILQIAGGDDHSQTRISYQPDPQDHIPTGFLRLGPWSFLDNPEAGLNRQNYLDEVTTTTASAFLGITMGCARCHDHKYDPIPSKDYYRFQAFFNAIKIPYSFVKGRIVEKYFKIPFQDEAFRKLAESKVQEYERRLENGSEQSELEEFESKLLQKLIAQKVYEAQERDLNVEDLRLELRKKESKIFTATERSEHADFFNLFNRKRGREERETLEAYEKGLLRKLAKGYARGLDDPLARFQELTVAEVRSQLGDTYNQSKYFTSEDQKRHRDLSEELQVLRRRLSRWRPTAQVVVNVEGPPGGPSIAPVRVLRGGDYRQPGEAVDPGFPSVLTGNFEPARLETDRFRQFPTRGLRMTLSKWIASPDNPLTSRVMINRIWQHHFGRGIVVTPNNFGKNGERPTHPRLLDWLAVKFVEQGWSVKKMHRLILNSATYRQSSDNPHPVALKVDPDNRLLWCFNRRRLEAEAIRDSILFVSGRLNLEREGPSVFPPLPQDVADLGDSVPIGGLMWEPHEKRKDAFRRSVYIFQRRSLPLPMMAAFDARVPNESCPLRSATTTPLQALSMMNGYLVHEEAAHLAHRIERETGRERTRQISHLFDLLFQRMPDRDELRELSQFPGTLESLCRVLLNSNEFLYIE